MDSEFTVKEQRNKPVNKVFFYKDTSSGKMILVNGIFGALF